MGVQGSVKAGFGIPELLQEQQTCSSHLLSQLKSFKEFVSFLQAPHYEVFPVFSSLLHWAQTVLALLGHTLPKFSEKKDEGYNFPLALNFDNHEKVTSAT